MAKHPVMFKAADCAIINKDITQFVNVDPDKMVNDALDECTPCLQDRHSDKFRDREMDRLYKGHEMRSC